MNNWTSSFKVYIKQLSIAFLLIMVLIARVNAQAQNNLDSLLEQLRYSEEDTSTIITNIEIGVSYKNSSPHTSSAYLKNALTLAQKIKSDKLVARSSYLLGANYLNLGFYEEAEELFQNALAYYKREGDYQKHGRTINYFGRICYRRGDLDKAFSYYEKALKIGERINDKELIANVCNSLGVAYWQNKELEKALDQFKKSLDIRITLHDQRGIGQNYNNIGLIYYDLRAYNNALEYYLKGLKIAEEINSKPLIITAHLNLGEIYTLLGDYENSEKYYEHGMEFAKETQNRERQTLFYIYTANSYTIQKKYKKSVEFGLMGLKMAQQLNDQAYQKDACENLVVAYEQIENYKEALVYHRLYKELCDNTLLKTKTEQIDEMQRSYEMLAKNSENQLLKKDKELQQLEIENKASVNKLMIIIAVAVFLLIILMYNKVQSKNRGNIEMEHRV